MAIKKIKHMCESISDAKHTVREIRLMRYLGRHENIISLKDLVVRDRYVSHAARLGPEPSLHAKHSSAESSHGAPIHYTMGDL